MGRMTAKIDATNVNSYDRWNIENILYSFLVDDYDLYEKNPEWRRMQLKKAILKSEEFRCVAEGGRLVGGFPRPYNPYGTNLGVRNV